MSKVSRWSLMSWLKSMMFKHMHGMISCREFEDFVQTYVDGGLPERQKIVFERHLRFCRECREYLAAYQRTVEIAQSLQATPYGPVPADVPENLIKAILQARTQ
jgi:anti-sigma factor RsiW